ncbi:MAG: hypothetical protein AAF657_14255 [Acidobacteriota bacterium]
MDHETIAARGWIELYHQGRLAPEDEVRFEAHFIECPQCMEQLELARGFERGLKTMVAEDATRATTLGVLAWLTQRSRGVQLGALLSAVLVVAGLPYLWFQAETRELRARVTSASAGIAVNTPVFLLRTVRSGPDRGDGPGAIVDLSSSADRSTPDRLSLAVDVGDDPSIASYRATLLGAGAGTGGEPLWQAEELRPNDLETLLVTFPSSFFAGGDYRLVIAGVRDDGSVVDLGAYPFRVAGP